jgi:uncharacterized protein
LPKLRLGANQFEFDIDDSFFQDFEFSQIKKGDLKVELEIIKKETMYELNFAIRGTVELACHRCLEQMSFPVEKDFVLILKLSENADETSTDEIIFIPRNMVDFNVAGAIYENIHLAVPMSYNCEMSVNRDNCDEEILKKIEKLSVKSESEERDPRWDTLKDLLN